MEHSLKAALDEIECADLHLYLFVDQYARVWLIRENRKNAADLAREYVDTIR